MVPVAWRYIKCPLPALSRLIPCATVQMFAFPFATAMLWWCAPRIDALSSGNDDLELEMEQANKPVVGGDFVGEKVSDSDADRTPGVGSRSSWRLAWLVISLGGWFHVSGILY